MTSRLVRFIFIILGLLPLGESTVGAADAFSVKRQRD
jgi:hypothetical protein